MNVSVKLISSSGDNKLETWIAPTKIAPGVTKRLPDLLTLVSDIHIGAVCCFSMRSTNWLYHPSPDSSSNVVVNTCGHNFSNFEHCSSSFFDDKCAFLQGQSNSSFGRHLLSEVVMNEWLLPNSWRSLTSVRFPSQRTSRPSIAKADNNNLMT